METEISAVLRKTISKLHILAADQGAVRLAEANDYVPHYQTTAIMARGKWAQENSEVVVHYSSRHDPGDALDLW